MNSDTFSFLTEAALDRTPVSGWTHNFYRYPARFSPRFAAAAIDCFSSPGDLILDPYMGGGTVVVEGLAAGRNVVGNDLNSLAAFITRIKVTPLTPLEASAVAQWAAREIPDFRYFRSATDVVPFIDAEKTRNLSLVRARFIKKVVAAALASLTSLPTANARDFARCIILRTSQWALDGRKSHTPLEEFRTRLALLTDEMLKANRELGEQLKLSSARATVLNVDASRLDKSRVFASTENRASLVVTSPPYPGVHVLYHRWQVDGRRETPAPYWIAGCNDGQGASYYNFGDRRETAADTYFERSLATLTVIRRVMRDGGHIVQLVAFNRPEDQLPRYLKNMRAAGFVENKLGNSRIWREVPNRKWHAALKGKTSSSREVVLVHRAV
jgi:DNA modification methylase